MTYNVGAYPNALASVLPKPSKARGNKKTARGQRIEPVRSGNLPTGIRYRVPNPDGGISTVRTISIGTDEGEVVIPTVVQGRILTDDEAIDHFMRTGENFGIFRSIQDASDYAESLHRSHAKLLKRSGK
jgi:hypothetical protein